MNMEKGKLKNNKKWAELKNQGEAYDWYDFGLPGCGHAGVQ